MIDDLNHGGDLREVRRAGNILLRGTVVLNFLLFALSWCPWHSEEHWSISDQLFGKYHLANFRVDFVWMIASTMAIFLVALFLFPRLKSGRSAQLDFDLCIAEILGFCFFIYGSLTFRFVN